MWNFELLHSKFCGNEKQKEIKKYYDASWYKGSIALPIWKNNTITSLAFLYKQQILIVGLVKGLFWCLVFLKCIIKI